LFSPVVPDTARFIINVKWKFERELGEELLLK
jgi:hypothetical protein